MIPLEVALMAEDKDSPENEEQEGKESGPKKKSGVIKLAIIGVAALVVIGGGVFAGYKFFSSGSQSGDETVQEQAEKESAEPQDPKALLFPLDPFVVNLGGPGNFLKITVQLEMSSPLDKVYLEDRIAQIRDSILILMSGKTPDSVVSPAGKLQLKDDINVRVNKALGKNLVRNVYFTEFVMQ